MRNLMNIFLVLSVSKSSTSRDSFIDMLPRTPPNKTQKNLSMDVIYPCCEEDDQYDAMVQCGRWHHFSCVGVDQSIAELVWYCRKCLGEDVSARESLGQPGVTRIQPSRAAKKSKDHTGKISDKTSQKRIDILVGTKGQKEVAERPTSQQEGNKGQETCQAGTSAAGQTSIAKSVKPSRSRVSIISENSRSESSKSGKNSKISGTSKSSSSKRDLALKRIEELKERSRLEALEEETQLQMLKVSRSRLNGSDASWKSCNNFLNWSKKIPSAMRKSTSEVKAILVTPVRYRDG